MSGQSTSRPPVISDSAPPVAENLRAAQTEAGLTNDELARRIDVSPRLLGRWRRGEVTPRWENLVRLADELDREPSWFYAVHEEQPA